MPSEIPTADYTTMNSPEVLKAMSDDASIWAAAFCQIAATKGHPNIDEGWMIAWFANAIEHSSDVRRWRREAAPRSSEDLLQRSRHDPRWASETIARLRLAITTAIAHLEDRNEVAAYDTLKDADEEP